MTKQTETFLVLGGAGFIGSHFCDKLIASAHRVICVDNLSLGTRENIQHLLPNDRFEFHEMDINSASFQDHFSISTIDTVVHLAANSDIAKSHAEPMVDIDNTLNTTLSTLKLMKSQQIKRIIFASSSAIYGEHEGAIHENIGPLFPHSHYGAAKLASEAFISSFCENYGIQSWMMRFPNVIGERCTHGVVYDFFQKIKADSSQLQVLGNGLQDKPYLYVHELIEGILHCYDTFKEDKINYFNLGTDSSTTVNRIVEILSEVFEIQPKIHYTGGTKGWIGDIPKFKYDLSKIHQSGWTSKLSSDQAVFETFKALKATWMQ